MRFPVPGGGRCGRASRRDVDREAAGACWPAIRAGGGSLWRYVLVDVEEVSGIVLPLDLNQLIIVLAVVDLNLAVIVVLHEVDVSARLRIRSHRLIVVAYPLDPLCILRGIVPRGQEHHPVGGLAIGKGRVAGSD